MRRRAEGLVDASSGTCRHAVRASADVRVRGHAAAPDVRVAADTNAVRANPDGHRGVDAARFLPAALFLAARILAAVLRPEQAAARERRRQRTRRERDLNRLSDDLVHSAPPFCFAGRTIPPDGAHYELFRFRCLLEIQRKRDLT